MESKDLPNSVPASSEAPPNSVPASSEAPPNSVPVSSEAPPNSVPVSSEAPPNSLPASSEPPPNCLPVPSEAPPPSTRATNSRDRRSSRSSRPSRSSRSIRPEQPFHPIQNSDTERVTVPSCRLLKSMELEKINPSIIVEYPRYTWFSVSRDGCSSASRDGCSSDFHDDFSRGSHGDCSSVSNDKRQQFASEMLKNHPKRRIFFTKEENDRAAASYSSDGAVAGPSGETASAIEHVPVAESTVAMTICGARAKPVIVCGARGKPNAVSGMRAKPNSVMSESGARAKPKQVTAVSGSRAKPKSVMAGSGARAELNVLGDSAVAGPSSRADIATFKVNCGTQASIPLMDYGKLPRECVTLLPVEPKVCREKPKYTHFAPGPFSGKRERSSQTSPQAERCSSSSSESGFKTARFSVASPCFSDSCVDYPTVYPYTQPGIKSMPPPDRSFLYKTRNRSLDHVVCPITGRIIYDGTPNNTTGNESASDMTLEFSPVHHTVSNPPRLPASAMAMPSTSSAVAPNMSRRSNPDHCYFVARVSNPNSGRTSARPECPQYFAQYVGKEFPMLSFPFRKSKK